MWCDRERGRMTVEAENSLQALCRISFKEGGVRDPHFGANMLRQSGASCGRRA